MWDMIARLGLLSLFIFSSLAASIASAAEKPLNHLNHLNIVFLYGNRSHGSGAHEFRAGSMLLAKDLNRQKKIAIKATTFSNWPKDESVLDAADAIIFYNDATQIIDGNWEKVNALAKAGKGIMLMHYAVHPSEKNGEEFFKPWVGGYFKNGQSVNPFWSAKIKPLAGHPTSRGVDPVETIDEFYHSLEFCSDCKIHKIGVATPTKKNLLTINNLWTTSGQDSLGKEQLLLWGMDRPDGGRGAGFTGGHFHHNWAFNELRQLVLNTIVWVAGGEVPADGVDVNDLTEDELNANLDDYGDQTIRLAVPTKANRPEFTPNKYLTPKERHDAKKATPEWNKFRGKIIGEQLIEAAPALSK